MWETLAALDTKLDIGLVFPPREGEARGRGIWTGKDLDAATVIKMLPRLAAANAQGAHVYMRLGPSARSQHPGIIMLDDLDVGAVNMLTDHGLEPCVVIETSLGSHQAWIRLTESGTMPYLAVHSLLRELALKYDADPRAVSPLQPGRLPGFTNRKLKYRQTDGRYPFVRVVEASPARVAGSGPDLVARTMRQSSPEAQAGARRGGAPETPHKAANSKATAGADATAALDAIHLVQQERIRDEAAGGHRPASAASQSEIDFAVARVALENGIESGDIEAWFSIRRPEKHFSYPQRTVSAAARLIEPVFRR